LRDADKDGLRPSDYHLGAIETLLARAGGERCAAGAPSGKVAADLELSLTDAFMVYGAHLLGGRINPETFDPEWHAQRREADLPALLREALASGVAPALQRLRPSEPGYRRLQQALARYHAIAKAGGFKPIVGEEPLKLDDQGPRVEALRRRLAAEALLAANASDGATFDAPLAAAVRIRCPPRGVPSDRC
jgi:murein L,D-transpeptidase YcbB/YkuD